MDHILGKFSELSETNNDDTKKGLLLDIKSVIDTLPDDELKTVAQNVNYNQIFAELFANDRDTVEHVCDILHKLFNMLEAGEVYERYHEAISKAVHLDNSMIKTLMLGELLRASHNPVKLAEIRKDNYLLGGILKSIGNDDLTIVQTAGAILKKIAENATGIQILCTQFHKELLGLMSENQTIAFRVLDIIVEISMTSKEGLIACDEAGFLGSLISLLSNEDVLVQLNALELITKLALTNDGLAYLESRGVLQQLSEKIARAEEQPLSDLLIPGLIKFFGNVAQKTPSEIFSKYPAVVSSLFQVIDSEDLAIIPIVLDTLGYIATRSEGKYALANFGHSMPTAMKKLSEIIENMPSELRVRGLTNLAIIIGVDKSDEPNNRISSLTKSWFDALGNEPLDTIVRISKQPFSDIRRAALEVLAVIAEQTWGQEYIANAPGLPEFLLDRNIETFKDCKEAKYNVVKALAKAEPNILDSNTMQRFQRFVNEGPMYVDTLLEIATESGP